VYHGDAIPEEGIGQNTKDPRFKTLYIPQLLKLVLSLSDRIDHKVLSIRRVADQVQRPAIELVREAQDSVSKTCLSGFPVTCSPISDSVP
jgi:hypothetical protein